MITILVRVLEVCIGMLSILNFRFQSKTGDRVGAKELLDKLEERDREIEKLKLNLHIWKMRYTKLTNVMRNKDLQSESF